jgi:hypothetical protein
MLKFIDELPDNEDGSRKSEVGKYRKSEVGSRKSENTGSQTSDFRPQTSDIRFI